ncbi:hypothetical protein Bca4012_004849 [Brassica carinata]
MSPTSAKGKSVEFKTAVHRDTPEQEARSTKLLTTKAQDPQHEGSPNRFKTSHLESNKIKPDEKFQILRK